MNSLSVFKKAALIAALLPTFAVVQAASYESSDVAGEGKNTGGTTIYDTPQSSVPIIVDDRGAGFIKQTSSDNPQIFKTSKP